MARIRRDTKLNTAGWVKIELGILNAGTGTMGNINIGRNRVIRIGEDKGRIHK